MSTSPLNDSHRPQLQYTGNTDAKMMDQNFEIRIVILENFLKISKRRRMGSLCGRSGPLWSRPN